MKVRILFVALFSFLLIFTGCFDTDDERDIQFSKVVIYEDGNNDGYLNRGEEAKIKVFLRNEGAYTAKDVQATLSPRFASEYVDVVYEEAYFGNLGSGEEDFGQNIEQSSFYWSYKIQVSPTCPTGYPLEFRLNVYDADENEWTLYFTMQVEPVAANPHFHSYTVYADDNSNGRIERGEEIKLKTFLQNGGSATVNDVYAQASIESPYITLLDSNADFNTLSPNEIDFGRNVEQLSFSWSYRFLVSNDCPYDYQATVHLDITDGNGNQWEDSFIVTVLPTRAELEYYETVIYEDDNSNMVLEPGETAKIKLFLENSGLDDALGVTARLSSESQYIDLFYDDARFYDMSAYEIDYGRNIEQSSSFWSYQFAISEDCPNETALPFSLLIQDENGNEWTQDFSLTVGE